MHAIGLLAFILSAVNIYFTHFYGPSLELQNFPSEYDFLELTQTDVNKPIEFSFYIYNSGGKTAFIQYFFINIINGSDKDAIYYGAKVNGVNTYELDSYIESKETKKFIITLPPPKARQTNDFRINIRYDPGFKKVSSPVVPATWY